jgi:putative intracellular protease/amidase
LVSCHREKPGHNFPLNADLAEVRAEDSDALVIPGGGAPKSIRLNEKALATVRRELQRSSRVF